MTLDSYRFKKNLRVCLQALQDSPAHDHGAMHTNGGVHPLIETRGTLKGGRKTHTSAQLKGGLYIILLKIRYKFAYRRRMVKVEPFLKQSAH